MAAHDEIIAALQDVLEPLGGEIRLIGRVNDKAIGNASKKEVFLMVPDLHIISSGRPSWPRPTG